MSTLTIEKETNNYWLLLKDISKEVKLALIAKLSASLVGNETKEEKKASASDFAGMWSDDEYLDSDEIIKILKSERRFNHDIEPL